MYPASMGNHLECDILLIDLRASCDMTPHKKWFYVLLPKLYLVVFYQVSLVNWTMITCLDFRRPLEVLLGSACCTISHVHTPWGNCNKCSSRIVSIKYSFS